MQHGVCVRVLGDLHMLPRDVMVAVARAVNYTKENTRCMGVWWTQVECLLQPATVPLPHPSVPPPHVEWFTSVSTYVLCSVVLCTRCCGGTYDVMDRGNAYCSVGT